MLAEQRAELILRELARDGAVSVARLCEVTGASEATIRRDLNALDSRGRLSKVHGGAVLPGEEFRSEEPDWETKRELRSEEKARIGRRAAALIEDDDVVYLDAGTTVMQAAEHVQTTGALFVTNSIGCAYRLTRRGLRTYVLGGALKHGTVAIIGAEATQSMKRYNFTKAFLGTNGISIRQGFTTPDPEEAAVKALAASRSREVYVLADSGKFGVVTSAAMFPLEEAVIITDRLADREYLEHTRVIEA